MFIYVDMVCHMSDAFVPSLAFNFESILYAFVIIFPANEIL